MGALKAIKINQNDGRAVFLCLPKTKYRVTKGFKFHARPQTGAYSCLTYGQITTHFHMNTLLTENSKKTNLLSKVGEGQRKNNSRMSTWAAREKVFTVR